MALNKVLILNEVQLLKLIQDNGYGDIANILENRHIDGKKFLELSEIQTLTWKLPPTQLHNLFDFIKRVKADPSIIIKQGPVKNTTTANKPTQNVPTISKADSFKPKPSFIQISSQDMVPIKKISSSNRTSPKPSSFKPNSSYTQTSSQEKTPKKEISSNSPTSPKPWSFQPKPSFTQTSSQDKAPKKKISSNISTQQNEFKQKLGMIWDSNNSRRLPKDITKKPILPKPIQTGITKPKPLPPEPDLIDEPDQPKVKPKAFLPEPTMKSNSSTLENKTNKLTPIINKRRSSSPELTYIDLDSKKDDPDKDYLSPNEFDSNDSDDSYIEPENTYELPPSINNAKSCTKIVKPYLKDDNVSLVPNRAPLPTPRETDQCDEEINDYEPMPVEKLNNLRDNIKTIGDNLDHQVEETEENTTKSIPEETIQSSKKITVEDLSNVIKIEREDSRRPTNFLDKINNFFAPKSKASKQDDLLKGPLNYENHMLQSEIPAIEILDSKPYKNRPLPEIPVELPTSLSPLPRKHEMISPKNKQSVLSTGGTLPRERIKIELPRLGETDVKTVKKATKPDNRNYLDTIESKKGKSRTSDNDVDDIIRMPSLPDDLALKISDTLKYREINVRQKTVTINKPLENLRIFCGYPSPYCPPSDNINIKEGNQEEVGEYVYSIFNINNEKFFRDTDRKGAKQLLHNLGDGAFLFRPSRRYFLVLTLKNNGKYYNLGIERTPTNKIRLDGDSFSVSPEFRTLRAFVEYFQREAITFKDGENLVEIYLKLLLPEDVF